MGFNTVIHKEDGCIAFEVDTRFFCEEAILKTAYQFTEQGHFDLRNAGEGVARVVVAPKQPGADLEHLVPEFLNELIDQELRVRVQR